VLVICLLVTCLLPANAGGVGVPSVVGPFDLASLSKPPKTWDCPEVGPLGAKALYYEGELNTPELRERDRTSRVRTLYYEGVPFQGKPTRVFAYLGIPAVPAGGKVPGMVLVHGGGGTAFESWVRLWNARGYAAIAMDTCGCLPVGEYGKWQRSGVGGPEGWGGFDQMDWPVKDQWTYQAVSAVILANSLLRAQPEVDARRVGLTGISWGGYLTCIASGIDNRFRFSVPVYGCGFLGDDSAWLPEFEKMGPDKAARWLKLWDPSEYLRGAAMPMLWVTGTNDFAYPMGSHRKSYRLPAGKRTLCIKVEMPHGHGGSGENPPEIRAFADSICLRGTPLASIGKQGHSADTAWVEFASSSPVQRAELVYTTDTGRWLDRKWHSIPRSSRRPQGGGEAG